MSARVAVLLAEGELSWPRGERVGDRYGAVSLQTGGRQIGDSLAELAATPENEALAAQDSYADFAGAPVGAVGRLVAEVVSTRDSYHIGDLSHGFAPETPEVGERIDLGSGRLFVEEGWRDAGVARYVVGLAPVEDDREFEGEKIGPDVFWLNPRALYRCHAQTVRLYFEEEK